MSHPDPNGPPDHTPIHVGGIWENPVTRERATILELPNDNPDGRATAELTALVGARVMGEHRHPALVERFTVLEGELTVKLAGQTTVLREDNTAVVEPGVWHDWWNASDRQDARDRVPLAAAGGATHALWRPGSHCTLARLPRDIPAALPYGSCATDVAAARSLSTFQICLLIGISRSGTEPTRRDVCSPAAIGG